MEEDDSLQKMAIQDIIGQILALDETYQNSRNIKEEEENNEMLKTRLNLLSISAKKGTLQYMTKNDRREDYLKLREVILKKKYGQTESGSKRQKKERTRSKPVIVTVRTKREKSSSQLNKKNKRYKEKDDIKREEEKYIYSTTNDNSSIFNHMDMKIKQRKEDKKVTTMSETTSKSTIIPINNTQKTKTKYTKTLNNITNTKYKEDKRSDNDSISTKQSNNIHQSDGKMQSSSSSSSSLSRNKIRDTYAFTGMHHIFAHHTKAVTTLEFAHEDRDLLAMASEDGTISLCSAFSEPPRVIAILKGHTGPVLDFDWSMSNDFLVSCSTDQTVRVWALKRNIKKIEKEKKDREIEKEKEIEEEKEICSVQCIRKVTDKVSCNCCKFHPFNTNVFIYGTGKGKLNVINLSTGKSIQCISLEKSVVCMDFTPTGDVLFVGDSGGNISVYKFNLSDNTMVLVGRQRVTQNNKSVTCLQYKGWYHKGKIQPQLIAACQDESLKVFWLNSKELSKKRSKRILTMKNKFPIVNKSYTIRSKFCPLISISDGACVVSGSEDSAILIYNVMTSGKKAMINKLLAHGGPVLDVAWNYEETLLASCDSTGMVILWKRIKVGAAMETKGN